MKRATCGHDSIGELCQQRDAAIVDLAETRGALERLACEASALRGSVPPRLRAAIRQARTVLDRRSSPCRP